MSLIDDAITAYRDRLSAEAEDKKAVLKEREQYLRANLIKSFGTDDGFVLDVENNGAAIGPLTVVKNLLESGWYVIVKCPECEQEEIFRNITCLSDLGELLDRPEMISGRHKHLEVVPAIDREANRQGLFEKAIRARALGAGAEEVPLNLIASILGEIFVHGLPEREGTCGSQ